MNANDISLNVTVKLDYSPLRRALDAMGERLSPEEKAVLACIVQADDVQTGTDAYEQWLTARRAYRAAVIEGAL